MKTCHFIAGKLTEKYVKTTSHPALIFYASFIDLSALSDNLPHERYKIDSSYI